MRERTRMIVREGVIAGVIGATAVALWFLVIDTMSGQPLFTPGLLGEALFSVLGPSPEGAPRLLDEPMVQLLGYTIFHYAAFVAVGLLAAVVLEVARREPSVLIGFFILFVAFEIGFHGLVALLQQTTALDGLAWYNIMIGNLIAASLMGLYLWQAHPELAEGLAHAAD